MLTYVSPRGPTEVIVFHNNEPVAKISYMWHSRRWVIQKLLGDIPRRKLPFGQSYRTLPAAKAALTKAIGG